MATSTYRVAAMVTNCCVNPERALGLPIDIISGPEEARLYLPRVRTHATLERQERLIVDIGGGSTEFIVGRRYDPELTESFPAGCGDTIATFLSGRGDLGGLRKADVFVRSRLEVLQRYKAGWAWPTVRPERSVQSTKSSPRMALATPSPSTR